MSKPTMQATIAAALLARGEVQEENNSRYLRFTRKFKGLRAEDESLVPSTSAGRWFVGRNGALRVGTKAASKGRATDKRVRDALVAEGVKVFAEQEHARHLKVAKESANPMKQFIDFETLELVTMESYPDRVYYERKREPLPVKTHDQLVERFTS